MIIYWREIARLVLDYVIDGEGISLSEINKWITELKIINIIVKIRRIDSLV